MSSTVFMHITEPGRMHLGDSDLGQFLIIAEGTPGHPLVSLEEARRVLAASAADIGPVDQPAVAIQHQRILDNFVFIYMGALIAGYISIVELFEVPTDDALDSF